jgi:hypothetical protein
MLAPNPSQHLESETTPSREPPKSIHTDSITL